MWIAQRWIARIEHKAEIATQTAGQHATVLGRRAGGAAYIPSFIYADLFDLAMSETPSSIFGHLDEARAKTLFNEVQRRAFAKNSFVINAGDKSNCFYLIQSGKVKIVILDEEGKEVFSPSSVRENILANFHS